MISQEKIEEFNIELKALQIKYGVEIIPAINLQLKEKEVIKEIIKEEIKETPKAE